METDYKPIILIVDDEPFNVDLLEQELAELGYLTLSATNGIEALEMVASRQPDLVLLDIQMPVMDGFQTLERLKRDTPTREIPVIVVSAMSDLASIVRGIELGALDYLPKPVETALLRARLESALVAKLARDRELDYLEQVGRVVEAALAVETGSFNPDSLAMVAARRDALGRLARVFQRMAREVAVREQRLKQQLQQARLDAEEMRRALTEPVSIYLPMDRRHALANGVELPERVSGAALFADISGFTPLTASLVEELGLQRGAEELTRQLEQVYIALIDVVHRYHGSVVGFSGDAITCWLDGDDGLRGLTCGLALQAAMQAFKNVQTPGGSPVSIAIKVAVVAGSARRFLVGDPAVQRVETLAGRLLEQLAQVEQAASPGDVLVPTELAERLAAAYGPDVLQISGWRESGAAGTPPGSDAKDAGAQTGLHLALVSALNQPVSPDPWPSLPPGTLSDEQCRPWLSPSIFERVRSNARGFLAELRPVAALFLLFRGIDYENDPRAGERLDGFLRWVQAVILRYDGMLVQLTIGDKGSYLSATFGAPQAHPDDALRAMRAAEELLRLPPELNFITSVQIGLAQGQARTGAYGSPAQRTYGMMGDKVNLAARLMQAAVAGLLVDEGIYRAVQGNLAMETLPPIKVKGKRAPVAVFRPAVFRPAAVQAPIARRKTGLVGRSAEQAAIKQALQVLQAGKPAALFIEAEAGMGKTRLLEELRNQAAEAGIRHFCSAGTSQDERVSLSSTPLSAAPLSAAPLSAWRPVLRTVFGLDSLPEPAAQAQRLAALLEGDLSRQVLAASLFRLFSLEALTGDLPQAPAPDHKAAATLLADLFIETCRPDPCLITIDDAQEFDPASWELAQALAARAAIRRTAVCLALAARPMPMPIPEACLRLQLLPSTQVLLPAPLSADDAYALACERLGARALPAPVQESLSQAGGNPYFILETADLLLDSSAVSLQGETLHVSTEILKGLKIPLSVQGMVASRLDRLSPGQGLVLKVASVAGRVFPQALVEAVFPVAEEQGQVGEILQQLEWLELVSQAGPGPLYRFNHPATVELAYNSMLFSQRRQLHRQAAEWYEGAGYSNWGIDEAALADHWLKAGETLKAQDYLEKAGQSALRRGESLKAEGYFKRALDLESQEAIASG